LGAPDIRESIADVLQVEPDASFEKARPLSPPFTQEMAMRTLPRLVTVRPAVGFIGQGLRGG
jgi:hypothetical protein